jgi:hypothetical protein
MAAAMGLVTEFMVGDTKLMDGGRVNDRRAARSNNILEPKFRTANKNRTSAISTCARYTSRLWLSTRNGVRKHVSCQYAFQCLDGIYGENVKRWNHSERNAMGMLWECYGNAMGIPWECYGNTRMLASIQQL